MSKTAYPIVGTKFRNPDAIAAIAAAKVGDPLSLSREPTNAFDKWAISVSLMTEGGWLHVGYLPSKKNLALAQRLDGDDVFVSRAAAGEIARLARSPNSGFPHADVEE